MNKSFESKVLKNEAFFGPFIYSKPSVSDISIKLFVLLFIQYIFLIFTKSYDSFAVVTTSLSASIVSSVIIYFITKEHIYNFIYLLNQGLIIGLLLPGSYPLLAVFSITLFTIVFSRIFIFKNINSWINISALSVIIAWTIGSKFFPSFLVTSDIVTTKNSSLTLIQNGVFPVYQLDSQITSFFNATVFKLFKITIPEGYVSLFWDSRSVIPAFRFNLFIIIASIILFADNSLSSLIPSLFLIVYAVLVRLFVPMIFGGDINQGDILLALLTSGTLFCSVFMIQTFGTIPITATGKIILGIVSGIVAFVVIGCGTSPIGMVYTVLICNIVNLFIRYFEDINNLKQVNKINSKYFDNKDK